MLEIHVLITAPEITASLNNLAGAFGSAKAAPSMIGDAPAPQPVPAAAPQPAPVTAPEPVSVAPGVPVVPVVPVAPTAPAPVVPVLPVSPVPTTVPTAAPQYDLDAISRAGNALLDGGQMEQLLALLAKYGIDNLTKLPKEQYGAMAADLRALGAKI